MIDGTLVARFRGAKEEMVRQQVEILAIMGELTRDASGRYQVAPREELAA
jgi:hypothetical protein